MFTSIIFSDIVVIIERDVTHTTGLRVTRNLHIKFHLNRFRGSVDRAPNLSWRSHRLIASQTDRRRLRTERSGRKIRVVPLVEFMNLVFTRMPGDDASLCCGLVTSLWRYLTLLFVNKDGDFSHSKHRFPAPNCQNWFATEGACTL